MAELKMACPFCGVQLVELSCPGCGRTFTNDGLELAAQWQSYSAAAAKRAESFARASEAARIQAVQAAEEARVAAANFEAARAAARQVLPTPPRPQPARPQPQPARQVPLAVLLQGTGAVLLLAALVVGSAVLWDVLSPAVQVALLAAVVAAVGFLTVATRRAIPTSSLILAGLTAAGGVVVGLTAPYLVVSLQSETYPLVASAIGTVLLLGAGRVFHVRFWWHAGLSGIAWTGLVAAGLVVELLAVDSAPSSLFALLFAPVAVGFLVVSSQADAETSRTASWLTVLTAAVVAFFALLGQLQFLFDFAARGIVAAAALVASGLWFAIAWRWGRRASAVIAAALLGPLPFVTFMPLSGSGLAVIWAAGLAVTLVASLVAYSWVRPGAGSWSGSLAAGFLVVFGLLVVISPQPDLASGWLLTLLWGMGFGAVLWLAGLIRSRPVAVLGYLILVGYWTTAWLFGRLPEAVEVPALFAGAVALASWWAYRRQAPVCVAQVIVAVSLTPTIVASWSDQDLGQLVGWRLGILTLGILLLANISLVSRNGWTIPVAVLAVAATGHALLALPGNAAADPKALIVAAGVGATLGAGAVDGWISGRLAGYLSLAVAAVPSALLVLVEPVWDSEVGYRLAIVISAAAVATVVAWRQPVLAWLSATFAFVVVLVVWADAASTWSWAELEVVTVPAALLLATSWALLGRALPLPLPTWQVALVVALIPSTIAASVDPSSWPRFAVVVLAWMSLAWLRWARPAEAAVFGGFAVLVTLVNVWHVLLSDNPAPAVELVTLPMAAAAAVMAFLLHRVVAAPGSSLWWSGPAVALVLWPTALVAWEGETLNWRVWVSLGLGSVILAIGARLELAGLVLPAVGALLFVVAPVLLRWTVDLPAWIPLTIFGVVLFAVGARLEATRRRGEQVLHWAAHLH